MSIGGNTLFPLPDADAAVLCRKLGLALSNAAMYGMDHAVTASSQAAAYDGLVALLDLYGEVEWGTCDDGLLLNGKTVDVSKGTAQTLADQMRRGNLSSFAFCPPPDRREFGEFMSILSAEPGAARIAGGVDAAIVRAGFRSIRVDKAVYARVGSKSAEKVPEKASLTPGARLPPGSGKVRVDGGTKGRVFDLDSELLAMDAEELAGAMTDAAPGDLDVTAQAMHYLEQRDEIRRQHGALVDRVRDCAGDAGRLEMLRRQFLSSGFSTGDWEALQREGGVSAPAASRAADAPLETLIGQLEQLAAQRTLGGGDPQSMAHALTAIGREVDVLIRSTRDQATTLAQRVDADRGTVKELEREARSRGVGLKLSREELLESLAEINQELVQPLTTSSALLQLLGSGKAGQISDTQRELLQTAVEGMVRLEKLIVYLQRISGFPVELNPDHELLSEVYGGPRIAN